MDFFENEKDLSDFECLPYEALYVILGYISGVDFLAVRCANKFFELLTTRYIPVGVFFNEISSIMRTIDEIKLAVLTNSKRFGNQKEFLFESLGELGDAIGKNILVETVQSNETENQNLFRELSFIERHLLESRKIVNDIANHKKDIAETFEIVDFSIRRYTSEIISLFPLEDFKPSLNEEGIVIWKELFGERMFVRFEDFMTLLKEKIPNIGEYQNAFELFYNFPRDGVMTPYRFHLLLTHFGPWDQLFDNFSQIACKAPFVGLVNAHSAKKLIEGFGYYVVRFSRKNPSALTLSYLDEKQGLKHRRSLLGYKNIKNLIMSNPVSCRFPSNSTFFKSTYEIRSISEYASSGYLSLIDSVLQKSEEEEEEEFLF
jgi:hypothetical protein